MRVFGADSCTCILAWQLHKLDIGTDGSVVKQLEGAGGRIDYHIVAACRIGPDVVYNDVGYIYHTTHWRQNTYHAKSPLLPCTRVLVVCSQTSLGKSFRYAIAAAWLALSGNAGQPACCVLPRLQLHLDAVSGGAPDVDASAGAQFSPWVFPPLPLPRARAEATSIAANIIQQCQLVCPTTSSNDEKRKMVKRLLVTWHPDKAVLMQRDCTVCHDVFVFLTRLRDLSCLD